MKVCDVVLNSIWYDPRVRKQIAEYLRRGVDICCVGMKCSRYDAERVAAIPCPTEIVSIDAALDRELHSVIAKLKRERLRNKAVTDAIVRQRPDVIHANDLNALIPAYRAAKKLGCKLIYDAHELNAENHGIGGLYQKYFYYMEKRLTKKVDRMVCVSHAAADYFAAAYHIPTPTVVTNCALKSEAVVGNVTKNPGFEVLNHGQFYEGRGYDIMLGAAPLLAEHGDIRLALRGFGRMEQQLRQTAEEQQLTNVTFYPPVLVQELIPQAAASAVGIAITEATCLNFELSVSNKLFEYAAAGLPVILSDIPEHRYLNDIYRFGVILKENTPQELAKAILQLYEDKAFYDRCAANARKLSDEVNWENEFDKLFS